VTDNSSIDCNIPVTDGLLQVFVPTFSIPVIQRVAPNFSIVFNCANLKLCPPDTNPLPELPDGIYRINYSVAPNMYVYVDYMYFRVSALVSIYNQLKYNLYQEKCNMDKDEFERRRKTLNDIKDKIDAGKYAVEDQHDMKMGTSLYSEAKSLLQKC